MEDAEGTEIDARGAIPRAWDDDGDKPPEVITTTEIEDRSPDVMHLPGVGTSPTSDHSATMDSSSRGAAITTRYTRKVWLMIIVGFTAFIALAIGVGAGFDTKYNRSTSASASASSSALTLERCLAQEKEEMPYNAIFAVDDSSVSALDKDMPTEYPYPMDTNDSAGMDQYFSMDSEFENYATYTNDAGERGRKLRGGEKTKVKGSGDQLLSLARKDLTQRLSRAATYHERKLLCQEILEEHWKDTSRVQFNFTNTLARNTNPTSIPGSNNENLFQSAKNSKGVSLFLSADTEDDDGASKSSKCGKSGGGKSGKSGSSSYTHSPGGKSGKSGSLSYIHSPSSYPSISSGGGKSGKSGSSSLSYTSSGGGKSGKSGSASGDHGCYCPTSKNGKSGGGNSGKSGSTSHAHTTSSQTSGQSEGGKSGKSGSSSPSSNGSECTEARSFACCVAPSMAPSETQSKAPTAKEEQIPQTFSPTDNPSMVTTGVPTGTPSGAPSMTPSDNPSAVPSDNPSMVPSGIPTGTPSGAPSVIPSDNPSEDPTGVPTGVPTGTPSRFPSVTPSDNPSAVPTDNPNTVPSGVPTGVPTGTPSRAPTDRPTFSPMDLCVLQADNPPSYSTCTGGPCCIQGTASMDRLECRSNCEACQAGISSIDCCVNAEVGICGGTTPICCKNKNGNSTPFSCIAVGAPCPQ